MHASKNQDARSNYKACPGQEIKLKVALVKRSLAVVIGLSFISVAAMATEGGGLASYPDGLENFMSGALPPPGVHSLVYVGAAKYDKVRDNSGNEVPIPNFKVNVGVVAPRLIWVTGQTVLGGQLAFHAIAPLLDVDFKAGPGSWRSTGLGDITFGPALGYHASPNLHYVAGVDIFAPTGAYDKTDPSSLGKNIWVIQPVFALSYIQPSGVNADIKVMYDFNMKNSATHTRSGQAIHADYALGWGFGNGWLAGVGGHVFQQVSSDSGPNAAAGKAQAFGFGPSIKYDTGKGFFFTAKLQREFDVKNRPEGTQLYVKAILPF